MDISLQKCTALRALTLHHHSPISTTVLALLDEVRAPGLRSLTLGVLATSTPAALPDFSLLGAHISDATLANLCEGTVLYSGALAEETVLTKLRADLPLVHEHGVLKVLNVPSFFPMSL